MSIQRVRFLAEDGGSFLRKSSSIGSTNQTTHMPSMTVTTQTDVLSRAGSVFHGRPEKQWRKIPADILPFRSIQEAAIRRAGRYASTRSLYQDRLTDLSSYLFIVCVVALLLMASEQTHRLVKIQEEKVAPLGYFRGVSPVNVQCQGLRAKDHVAQRGKQVVS